MKTYQCKVVGEETCSRPIIAFSPQKAAIESAEEYGRFWQMIEIGNDPFVKKIEVIDGETGERFQFKVTLECVIKSMVVPL
jgi:hypothetical protein